MRKKKAVVTESQLERYIISWTWIAWDFLTEEISFITPAGVGMGIGIPVTLSIRLKTGIRIVFLEASIFGTSETSHVIETSLKLKSLNICSAQTSSPPACGGAKDETISTIFFSDMMSFSLCIAGYESEKPRGDNEDCSGIAFPSAR
jgi:hypothetical protein